MSRAPFTSGRCRNDLQQASGRLAGDWDGAGFVRAAIRTIGQHSL